MKTEKDLGVFKRFITPMLGVFGCVFMVFCAIYAYRMDAVYYLIVFGLVMLLGFYLDKRTKAKSTLS